MRRDLALAEAGISLLSIILWSILPVFSFVLLIPLANLDGWTLSTRINQALLLPMGLSVLMIAAAVVNNRLLMQVLGMLQIVLCVLVLVFRKELVMHGSLNWVVSLLKVILEKLGNLIHLDISQESIDTALDAARLAGDAFGNKIPRQEYQTVLYFLQRISSLIGKEVSEENIIIMLERIVSDSLIIGVGFYLHLALSGAYLALSFLGPNESKASKHIQLEPVSQGSRGI